MGFLTRNTLNKYSAKTGFKKKDFRLGTWNNNGRREFEVALKTFIPLPKNSNTKVQWSFTGKTSHSSGLFNCNEKKREEISRWCNIRPIHGSRRNKLLFNTN